jgi:carbonic anhydrase
MNRRHALKALTGLALCPLCASTGFAVEGTHWTYGSTAGPDKWGDVDAESKVCSVGSQQSPIDIIGSIKAQLPPLRISWGKNADTMSTTAASAFPWKRILSMLMLRARSPWSLR